MKDQILVDQKTAVSFSKPFEDVFGKFEISKQNEISLRIKSFSLNDVQLVECPENNIKGTVFAEHVLSFGLVPLNIFHARAIYKNNANLCKVSVFLGKYIWKKGFKLETINFFGSLVSNKERKDNIVCFKFENPNNFPKFVCFENEDDIGWSTDKDLALVFTDRFIKKFLANERGAAALLARKEKKVKEEEEKILKKAEKEEKKKKK